VTLTETPAPSRTDASLESPLPVEDASAEEIQPQPAVELSARRVVVLVTLSGLVLVAAAVTVLYAVGPLVHNRDQRSLMATEREAIAHAAAQTDSLYGPTLPTIPPVPGDPVGILAIPALGLQQAVVEGVSSSQTVGGPGHVPGTAGMGQPGNAAVVGRSAAYGGPLGDLAELRPGDRVVAATIEGQVTYVVRSVLTVTLTTVAPVPAGAASGVKAPSSGPTHTGSGPVKTNSGPAKTGTSETTTPQTTNQKTLNIRTLYGPSTDNQLTLVTSSSSLPWNTDQAVVVVARMQGKPFPPTPQESRSPSQQGNSGEATALAWLLLALITLIVVLVGAVALYRRCTTRTAYLLTTAPLLALTVLAAEAASHLLPAWT
jgi:sortase A